MHRVQAILAATAIVLAEMSGPVTAQGNGFDPREPCGLTLRAASDTDKLLIASWVLGYVAATDQDTRLVDRENMVTLLSNVFKACAQDETRSLVALMQKHDQAGSEVPGSKASAERFLNQFLDSGADLAALTSSLAPTSADISAVYGEPLASRLDAMYAQMYSAGTRIGPKPDQNALSVVRTTTGSLKLGDAVLSEFPGGYAEVLPHIIGDYPIVRFKFLVKGESLGLAFDGLIHVNGRWVLMPKPWRALE
ncbi:MAG: hypothetical protein GY952_04485 [Rhodobacteraceae bacterium]|nr:hypothetical protein [Paracoccaceae bacterium]